MKTQPACPSDVLDHRAPTMPAAGSHASTPSGDRTGTPPHRRRALAMLALLGGAVMAPPRVARAATPLPPLLVHKTPTCGCCGAWVDHMRGAGFTVEIRDLPDTAPVRRRLGLPEAYGSCHTGLVAGYVVEGHVPAAEVKRLLSDRPEALGLAVPGMPIGSPGMEMGPRLEPYVVLLIGRDGRSSPYARYPRAAS